MTAGLGALATSPPAATAEENRPIGQEIEPFALHDFRGKLHRLADYDDSRVLVLVFVGNDCPLVKLYLPRLTALADEYAPQGVTVLAINSNVQDTPTEMAAFARHHDLTLPLLKDAGNRLADAVGATRTPEVVVLDSERTIRYRGRIDDQYGVGFNRGTVRTAYLADAIESLLSAAPLATSQVEPVGCLIGRVPTVEPQGDVTWSGQIASIFHRRCAECHREGEIGPFPLTAYDEVLGWGEMIVEVVSESRMPPWFADPKYGHFANDSSMTDEEKQLIYTWVANGCPEGRADDAPEVPEFVSGWRIDEPDLVFRMPEPYDVPAEGTVDYVYVEVDPQLTEDVWVSAAEARPDNAAVVHHIVLYAVPPGGSRAMDSTGGFGQMLAIYAPGMPPWVYPEGTAMHVKAGSRFVFQMHYTPNGTAQRDQSYVGLKLAPAESVRRKARYGMALNVAIEIPPHAEDYPITSMSKFRRDTLLLSLFPHMHYRGKSFRFVAEYPDGSSEILLDVPRYDFNWQLRYDLVEAKLLPKGTVLRCYAQFDNSLNNNMNPNPDETVRFGLQSWEEMMVGYYTIVSAEEDVEHEELAQQN